MRIVYSFLTVVAVFAVALCASFAHAGNDRSPTTKPATSEQPMVFRIVRASSIVCEPDCPEWIAAQGEIMPYTAAQLAQLLKDPAKRKLPLVINSGGGSLVAALEMGRMLRRFHMDTTVGRTVYRACPDDLSAIANCKPSPVLQAYDGRATDSWAFCASACPLVLLGGVHRVVDPMAFVGLHEPLAKSNPYVDKYWVKYRVIKGKRHIISRSFAKRIYLPPRRVVGVTPYLKVVLSSYIKEMGGNLSILDEMNKASPENINWLSNDKLQADKLALVTQPVRKMDTLTGFDLCSNSLNRPSNCVHLKTKEPQNLRPSRR